MTPSRIRPGSAPFAPVGVPGKAPTSDCRWLDEQTKAAAWWRWHRHEREETHAMDMKLKQLDPGLGRRSSLRLLQNAGLAVGSLSFGLGRRRSARRNCAAGVEGLGHLRDGDHQSAPGHGPGPAPGRRRHREAARRADRAAASRSARCSTPPAASSTTPAPKPGCRPGPERSSYSSFAVASATPTATAGSCRRSPPTPPAGCARSGRDHLRLGR